MYPIYIPSKARSDYCLTADIFIAEGIDVKIVIEPQDREKYKEKYEKYILVMEKNDQGIAYVRNWCKKHALNNKDKFHWQIDDNIRAFRRRENKKNIRCKAIPCLQEVEDFICEYKNIGIVGLRHTMYAFSQKQYLSLNQQVYSCVLVNNYINVWWRDNCVEDTDYSLQILFENYCTIIFNTLLIEKPPTMQMKGGNTEIAYGGDGRLRRSFGLQILWPGIFDLTYKYGRPKMKPSRIWQTFKQVPIKYDKSKS